MKFIFKVFCIILMSQSSIASIKKNVSSISSTSESEQKKVQDRLTSIQNRFNEKVQNKNRKSTPSLIFDIPVTYNRRVSFWINFFQTKGQRWFREWMERSTKYMPMIQVELKRAGLPQDLAYMVMIESGFSATAVSHANAVGPWQFIQPTGERYGLKTNWWIDERRDLKKSTQAAIRYIRDLYSEFGSWYLVAASYNMGENGLRRQVQKHKTRDFWRLAQLGALPQETTDYVPKILAAMLISKAPNLYGFRDLTKMDPLEYEIVQVPGGTDLNDLAEHLGVTKKSLKELNSELLMGYIPRHIPKHSIRIPRGAMTMVTEFVSKTQKRATAYN